MVQDLAGCQADQVEFPDQTTAFTFIQSAEERRCTEKIESLLKGNAQLIRILFLTKRVLDHYW